ncbi:MAG: peptidylprolyl isomerase [Rhodobacteraceae bacterium]|nr:peptidylprolyl isomerase [Paracoccaceae bacterium]
MPKVLKPLLALALSAGLALPVAAEEISANTVVATVGKTEITLGHMIVLRAQLPNEYQQLPDDVLYTAVLDQLIRQSAVVDAIGDDLSLGAKLALENERRSFLAGEALSRIAEEAVTDESVQAAYDAIYGNAEPTKEYRAAHILVATQQEAAAILDELKAGADFAELAKEKSTGPSGPNGGDLGWFSAGMMVKPFEDAILGMEPGSLAGPIETQFGWHVIKLDETRLQDAPALGDVRAELIQSIQTEAMEKALNEMTEKAEVTRTEVEIDPALLKDRDLLSQ